MESANFIRVIRLAETTCLMVTAVAVIVRLMDDRTNPEESTWLARALAGTFGNRTPFGADIQNRYQQDMDQYM